MKLWAICFISIVSGHGRMTQPPHRGYMSKARPESGVPADSCDHCLNAGGVSATHVGGKDTYGMCGDPYTETPPRAHETGGTFGLFPTLGSQAIGACYRPGEEITIELEITANHQGTMRYQLCELANREDSETEACFQPLTLPDGAEGYTLPSTNTGIFRHTLQLPNVVCEGDAHCVLRWHWTANNSPGAAVQEEFWNCADIYIGTCTASIPAASGNVINNTPGSNSPLVNNPGSNNPTQADDIVPLFGAGNRAIPAYLLGLLGLALLF